MENIKEGLIEKKEIGDVEGKLGMKREGDTGLPKKRPVEKVSKAGKSFKIC